MLGIFLAILAELILRQFYLPPWARLFGVLAVCLSPEVLLHARYPRFEIYIWHLVSLLGLLIIWKNKDTKNKILFTILFGTILGWSHYGSHLQYTFIGLVPFIIAFSLSLSILTPGGWGFRRPRMDIVFSGLALVALMTLVGAWNILPNLELLDGSYRAVMPKGAFFPIIANFLPFPIPQDIDLLGALTNWFGLRGTQISEVFPGNLIPVLGYRSSSQYFQISFLFLAFCTLFDARARACAMPFFLAWVIIVGGYNALALLMKIDVIRSTFELIPFVKSVYPGVTVGRASIFIWFMAGFGAWAFVRIASSSKWPILLYGMLVLVISGAAFLYAQLAREAIDTWSLSLPQMTDHPGKAVDWAIAQGEEFRRRWTPIHWVTGLCIFLLVVDGVLLRLLLAPRLRTLAALGFVLTFSAATWATKYPHLVWYPWSEILPENAVIKVVQGKKDGRFMAVRPDRNAASRVKEHLNQATDRNALRLGHVVRLSHELPVLPGYSSLVEIEDLRGVSAFANRDYRMFLESLTQAPFSSDIEWPQLISELIIDPPVHSKAYDLLNARWIASPKPLHRKGYELLRSGPPLYLYENTGALPRVWFTGKVRVIEDREALFKTLRSPDHDLGTILLERPPVDGYSEEGTRYGLRSEVWIRKTNGGYGWVLRNSPILDTLYPLVPPNLSRFEPESGASARVSIIEKSPGRLKIDIEADGRGMIVFSEVYFPGWRLRVDGKPADLYRANFSLMATTVNPGRHVIELFYQQASTGIGRIVTLLTIVVAFFAALLLLFRRRPAVSV